MHAVAGSHHRQRLKCFVDGEDVTNKAVEASEEDGFVELLFGEAGNRSTYQQMAQEGCSKTYTRFGKVRLEVIHATERFPV